MQLDALGVAGIVGRLVGGDTGLLIVAVVTGLAALYWLVTWEPVAERLPRRSGKRRALDALPPPLALRFGDPEISGPGPKGSVVRVPVVNDPGDSPIRVDGVYATLRIDKPDGSPLIADVEGAWSDTPDPEISIEPNGRPRYIDTVTQEANGMLYVWTERGKAVKQVWGMLDQQSQIGDQQCDVHVTVRGSNTEPITKSFSVAPGMSRPRLVAAEQSFAGGSPRERLSAALAEAMKFRTRLNVWDSPTYWGEGLSGKYDDRPSAEHPLFKWADQTYRLVLADFGDYADEFYGEDKADPAYFPVAYALQTEPLNGGRMAYLERRIALLEKILRETRPVG